MNALRTPFGLMPCSSFTRVGRCTSKQSCGALQFLHYLDRGHFGLNKLSLHLYCTRVHRCTPKVSAVHLNFTVLSITVLAWVSFSFYPRRTMHSKTVSAVNFNFQFCHSFDCGLRLVSVALVISFYSCRKMHSQTVGSSLQLYRSFDCGLLVVVANTAVLAVHFSFFLLSVADTPAWTSCSLSSLLHPRRNMHSRIGPDVHVNPFNPFASIPSRPYSYQSDYTSLGCFPDLRDGSRAMELKLQASEMSAEV